jgi:hypothetical protein
LAGGAEDADIAGGRGLVCVVRCGNLEMEISGGSVLPEDRVLVALLGGAWDGMDDALVGDTKVLGVVKGSPASIRCILVRHCH